MIIFIIKITTLTEPITCVPHQWTKLFIVDFFTVILYHLPFLLFFIFYLFLYFSLSLSVCHSTPDDLWFFDRTLRRQKYKCDKFYDLDGVSEMRFDKYGINCSRSGKFLNLFVLYSFALPIIIDVEPTLFLVVELLKNISKAPMAFLSLIIIGSASQRNVIRARSWCVGTNYHIATVANIELLLFPMSRMGDRFLILPL